MRIIDVDELIKNDPFHRCHGKCNPWWDGYLKAANEAYVAVENAPTIDAVKVVRCKDCRFLIDRNDGTYGCYRHFVEECKLDDYCSYGEEYEKD